MTLYRLSAGEYYTETEQIHMANDPNAQTEQMFAENQKTPRTLNALAAESSRVDREINALKAEIQTLKDTVRSMQRGVATLNFDEFERIRQEAIRIVDEKPPAPVELPAHWRALSQLLRNLADRIVHMTSADRGHLLKQLSDVEWTWYKGEWETCCVCDEPDAHAFDCPVKALETLMKVHGGVL